MTDRTQPGALLEKWKAERDALLTDALRYRWLRAGHERIDPLCHVVWKVGSDRNGSDWVNTASLDADIDAARTKGGTTP